MTGICLNVNPARPGAAYGYVDMGGWVGGQSEYVMIPYADFNLLKFPDPDQAREKIERFNTSFLISFSWTASWLCNRRCWSLVLPFISLVQVLWVWQQQYRLNHLAPLVSSLET
ncbi:hypothetical protein P4S64_17025 [Vibrio sp. M60_M31a]